VVRLPNAGAIRGIAFLWLWIGRLPLLTSLPGERTATQLLMCDRYEKTRSWFRVVSVDGGRTVLQFGSAVAASRRRATGAMSMGWGFRSLMAFHVLYSRVLLGAARRRVTKK
jgi:hypothetical protein